MLSMLVADKLNQRQPAQVTPSAPALEQQ